MYKYNQSVSEQLTQGKFDYPIKDDYHYILVGDVTVAQLKKAGILPDRSYKGLMRNKPDGLILLGKNNVKCLVEHKKPGVFFDFDTALGEISQWYYDLAARLDCHVVCITDGSKSYWVHVPSRKEITYPDGAHITTLLNTASITSMDDDYSRTLASEMKILEQIDEEGHIFHPTRHNPQNLARNVWQKIWITTGKQPEQCLYNVVEIFVFKYLSDLNILKNEYTFRWIYGKSEHDAEEALRFYAVNVRPKIRTLFPKSDTDNTTIINGTIFVNENGEPNLSQSKLFKEVLRLFYNYDKEYGSFFDIDKNFKTRLYENFLRRTAGLSSMGQYFTPRNVVKAIINMSGAHNVPENAAVCDPFCGVGGFILEYINENPWVKNQFIPDNGQICPDISLTGYDRGTDEKDTQRTIILAKANMLIYLSDIISQHTHLTECFSRQVFNKVFHLLTTNVGTFGITADKDRYDLVLTNPPYVTSGTRMINDTLKESGIKDEIYPVPCLGLEGLAMEWIIYSLKPGGTAFIVVPEGMLRRKDDQRLRNYILDTCTLNAVVSLPTRTFFATPQDTYILSVTKKREPEQKPADYNVFTYLISEIGETRDSNRLEIESNDLEPASIGYRQFMAVRNAFKSSDPRCKIQSVGRFKSTSWIIKDDWSDSEKKDLGIEIQDSLIKEDEFWNILSDISSDTRSAIRKSQRIDVSGFSYRTVSLRDIGTGFYKGRSLYTKTFCNNHKGEYPVYSADTKGSRCIGHIDTYDWDTECVTITTNGHYAGTPNYIPQSKFNMNGDCGCFLLKDEYLDCISYQYLEYALQNKRTEYGLNWKNKPSPDDLLDLEIKIPVDDSGKFDMKKQKQIIKKLSLSKNIRQKLDSMIKRLSHTNIDVIDR